jgi:hypothetical protein
VSIEGWEIALASEDEARAVITVMSPSPGKLWALQHHEIGNPTYRVLVSAGESEVKPLAEVIRLLRMTDHYNEDGSRKTTGPISGEDVAYIRRYLCHPVITMTSLLSRDGAWFNIQDWRGVFTVTRQGEDVVMSRKGKEPHRLHLPSCDEARLLTHLVGYLGLRPTSENVADVKQALQNVVMASVRPEREQSPVCITGVTKVRALKVIKKFRRVGLLAYHNPSDKSLNMFVNDKGRAACEVMLREAYEKTAR